VRLLTVVGTRPEIIRLSLIIPKLDRVCDHILVHTGQNFDDELNDVFFRELAVRKPDECLAAHRPQMGAQIGTIIEQVDAAFERHRPDRVLILGDTDSGLCAIPAARRGIPVFHLEAGNRCYDTRVPEEINRRIIDHASTVLLPYTHRSKENLLREGIARQRIFVVGNPIGEVLSRFDREITASTALQPLGLIAGQYTLVTLHRAENVDVPERLKSLVDGLVQVGLDTGWPTVVSLHPRTRQRLARFGLDEERAGIRMLRPMGLFDFVALERAAGVVLTDSGTVQEECCILKVPNVTLRDTSERLETVECGSNILAGTRSDDIVAAVKLARALGRRWEAPPEYLVRDVSETVARIVVGPVHHLVSA
jgi:UDP-N-acetylglucosamine 2-epimerase (non-hydrolysing)